MATVIERTPIRRNEFRSSPVYRQSREFSSVPTGLKSVAQSIREVADKELPVRINGKTLSSEHLNALADELTSQSTGLTDSLLELRLAKLKNTLPDIFDPLARFVGGRLKKLKTEKGKRLFPRRSRLYPAAVSLLTQLPLLTQTPPEFVPKPAPKKEVLTDKMLEDAIDYIELSEEPNSVAHQLLDPLKLNSNGLIVIAKPRTEDEEINRGFTVPSALLEILRSLKYPESEPALRNWILTKCSGPAPERAIRLLKTLVNFTAFLDSTTHLELFEATKVPGREQPEILLQPFRSLLNSVRYTHTEVHRADTKHPILANLRAIGSLIRIRYSEVYGGAYRTSLYTFSPEALTPNSETFAKLALSMIEFPLDSSQSLEETADILVHLVESIEVKDIRPLIAELNLQPNLQSALIEKAKKSGLIPYPEAVPEAIEILRRRPWRDAANINFAEIIDVKTSDLEIFVFTGTFGPFHKGHRDSLRKLLAYIDSLPQEEGNKTFQRIVLIAPLTDVTNISQYKKSAAQVGSVESRVGSILLQLPEDVNHQKVFITTTLQPDTARTRSLEGSISATVRKLETKISRDLDKAGRAAEFERIIRYVFGPDEIQWSGDPRQIDSTQRRKVTHRGGVCLARRGWQSALLREHQKLAKLTGIEVVNLAPGNPCSSSRRLTREIARRGDTEAVMATAKEHVLHHWGPQAIEERQNTPPPSHIPSVDKIYQRLIKELEASSN